MADNQEGNSNKGGIFKGNSHDDGGIDFVVKETGQQIEVEGNEPLITNDALNDSTVREYKGTNFEILNQINKSVGANGLSDKAVEVHAGDVIICKATLQDKTVKTLKGTNKQVCSAINAEAGCKVIESGATITDSEGTKQFKDGGKVPMKTGTFINGVEQTPQQIIEKGSERIKKLTREAKTAHYKRAFRISDEIKAERTKVERWKLELEKEELEEKKNLVRSNNEWDKIEKRLKQIEIRLAELSGNKALIEYLKSKNKMATGGATIIDDEGTRQFAEGGSVGSMKTKKDEDGNWTGTYLGMTFTLYNLQEGWYWSLQYDSPIMGSNQRFNSEEDYLPTRLKKQALLQIKNKIEELVNYHNDFNEARREFKDGGIAEGDIVESDNFKAWFGDSKVVDDSGNPLVVYHGTPNEITVFNKDYGGQTTANNEFGAFYFSNEYDVAEDYSRQAYIRMFEDRDEEEINYQRDDFNLSDDDVNSIIDDLNDWAEKNLKVIPVYLKIENPYIIDMKGEVIPTEKMQKIIGFLKDGVSDGDVSEDFYDEYTYDEDEVENYKDEIEERAREEHGLDDDEEIEDWQLSEATDSVLEENEIYKELPEYDGIIVENTIDDIGEKSNMLNNVYIAFEPNQIKLADGTNTIFSPYNPDIRFAEGGDTDNANNFKLLDFRLSKNIHEQPFGQVNYPYKTFDKGGEVFEKLSKEQGELSLFQLNFISFLEELKDNCKILDIWYDSNPNNYAYNKNNEIVLFDIEDWKYVSNKGKADDFIKKYYPNIQPLEKDPFYDNNYVFIGYGEGSMGGVFKDKRDGSILKITGSPTEVIGTHKVLESQVNDGDNPFTTFVKIHSIQNLGTCVLKGTARYNWNKNRGGDISNLEWNWFAIRREGITPFNKKEQLEAYFINSLIAKYHRNKGFTGMDVELFSTLSMSELKNEYQFYLKSKKLEESMNKNRIFKNGGSTNKRYVADVDFYVYAKDDKKATENAKEIASEIDKKYDNEASVNHLHERKFGSMETRKVFKNGGDIGSGYDFFKVVVVHEDRTPEEEIHIYYADAYDSYNKHESEGLNVRMEGWMDDDDTFKDIIYKSPLHKKGETVSFDGEDFIVDRVMEYGKGFKTKYNLKSVDGNTTRNNIPEERINLSRKKAFAEGGETNDVNSINLEPQTLNGFKKSISMLNDNLGGEGKRSVYSNLFYQIQNNFFEQVVSYNPTLLLDMLKFGSEELKSNERFEFGNVLSGDFQNAATKRFFDNLRVPLWKLIPEELKKVSKLRAIPFLPKPDNEGLGKIMDNFMGRDELRPVMSGVFFDKENDNIVATDAHRMLILNSKLDIDGSKICYMGKNLKKQVKDDKSTFKDPYEADKFVEKMFDEEGCYNIEGKFPSYLQVIPRENPILHTIDAYSLYKFSTVITKSKLNSPITHQIILKTEEFLMGVNSKHLSETLKGMLMLGYNEVDLLFSEPRRAIVIVPKGGARNLTQKIDTDMALVMPTVIHDEDSQSYKWVYDLKDKCIENIDLEKLGCVDVDDDSVAEKEREITKGSIVKDRTGGTMRYYVDSIEGDKLNLYDTFNVRKSTLPLVNFERVPEDEEKQEIEKYKAEKAYKSTIPDLDEQRKKFPIVMEWTEGAKINNKGYSTIDELEQDLISFGFTSTPNETYIKNKIWVDGYPSDIIVYLSKQEGDFDHTKQSLLEWLSNYDKDFNFKRFSEEYTEELKQKIVEEKEKIAILKKQSKEAVESLKVLLSMSKGQDAKEIQAEIDRLQDDGSTKPKGKEEIKLELNRGTYNFVLFFHKIEDADEGYLIHFRTYKGDKPVSKLQTAWSVKDLPESIQDEVLLFINSLSDNKKPLFPIPVYDDVFEALYKKYNDKDYWDVKDQIKTQVGNWERALEEGQEEAKKFTKDDVIDNVKMANKIRTYEMFESLRADINHSNLKRLKERVRYDQKFTLDAYEAITGEKIKGKNNKQLREYLDKKYGSSTYADGGVIPSKWNLTTSFDENNPSNMEGYWDNYENITQKDKKPTQGKYKNLQWVETTSDGEGYWDKRDSTYAGGGEVKVSDIVGAIAKEDVYGKTQFGYGKKYEQGQDIGNGGKNKEEVQILLNSEDSFKFNFYDKYGNQYQSDEILKRDSTYAGGGSTYERDNGVLSGKFKAEISVPYNFESKVKDEYQFESYLSKVLTKKWFGNGVFGVEITKPLHEINHGQFIEVEIEIPIGVTQNKGIDSYLLTEFISKTLTKKWFGNGVWGVKVVSTYSEGGEIKNETFFYLVGEHGLYLELGHYKVDTGDGMQNGVFFSQQEAINSLLDYLKGEEKQYIDKSTKYQVVKGTVKNGKLKEKTILKITGNEALKLMESMRFADGGSTDVDGLETMSKIIKYLDKNKFNYEVGNSSIKITDKNFSIENQDELEKLYREISISSSSNSNTWFIFFNSSYKMADGGSADLENANKDVDWDAIFAPPTEDELEKWSKEGKDDKQKEKNQHAKNINAVGKDWNEAVMLRLKSAKSEIEDMVKYAKLGQNADVQSSYNYALENIDSVREMGYEAKEYADNLKKKADKLIDSILYNKNWSGKYADGGGVRALKTIKKTVKLDGKNIKVDFTEKHIKTTITKERDSELYESLKAGVISSAVSDYKFIVNGVPYDVQLKTSLERKKPRKDARHYQSYFYKGIDFGDNQKKVIEYILKNK